MNNTRGSINFDITANNDDLKRKLAESRQALLDSGRTAEEQGSKIESMFKRAAVGAGVFFSAQQALQFAKQIAVVRGEFQQLEVSFATLLQSKEKANILMAQMVELAAKTPFSLRDVAQGAKQLVAYGFAAEEVNDTMMRLGNVAAGLGLPMERLTYLYGTTMTQGRLYARDLIQFTTSGVPMLQGLADMFGVTTEKVNKMVSDGKVGFTEVKKVFENLTSEGGKFHGLMEDISKTITGRISNLGDAIDVMFNKMGQSQEGFISSSIGMATSLVENYEKVGKALLVLISAYGTYKAAIIAVSAYHKAMALYETIKGFGQMTIMLRRTTQAQILLNQAMGANPILKIISLLVAAGTALYLFTRESNDANESLTGLTKAINDAGAEFDKESSKVKALQDVMNNSKVAYDERKRALNELKSIIPGYNAELNNEGVLINNNTEAIKQYLTQLERQIKLKAVKEELENAYKDKFVLEKDYDTKYKDWSSKNTNSAYHDKPIIDVAGMFGGRDLQKAEKAKDEAKQKLNEIEATISSLNSEIEKTADNTGGATDGVKSFSKQVQDTAAEITELTQKLKDLRAGKSGSNDFAKDIEETGKSLKEAQAKYNLLLGIDKGAAKSDKPKDYTEQLSKDAQAQARLEVDFEHAVRQAEINAKNEGIEKVLAQNQLNFDKEKEQVARQKADMLADIQNWERNIWEAQNPKWEKEGKKFTPKTTQLSSEQLAGFDTMVAAASKKMELANEDSLKKMLDDFMTYEQQRDKITEDYAKKRKSMHNKDGSFKAGFMQGNEDELNRNENEALKAIDEQFAQRESTYISWCEQITNNSLESLKEALAQAKNELEKAEKQGVGGSKFAAARAKVNKAQEKVDKTDAAKKTSPGKRTLKEWKDLHEVLQDIQREFGKIGDAVGGAAGKAISTAGQIAGSTLGMINSIQKLTTTSVNAMTGVAEVGAATMSTIEKASVILAIIAAAMQVAMAIVNLFNNDETYQKEIDKLQGRIKQLQWELDNADATRLQNNSFNALKKIKEVYAETTREVLKSHAVMYDGFYKFFKRTTYQNEIIQKSAEKLAAAYANIKYSADKALGSIKYDEAKNQLNNIVRQQLLIQEQIGYEYAKKDIDDEKIEDWKLKIQELGEEAVKIINELVEGIIGGSAADLASELGDAFIEAFQSGEDAAKAWGDAVNDIVADIVKRMLVQEFLEKPLGDLFDKYKEKWFNEGQPWKFDTVNNSMLEFASDLNGLINNFQSGMDGLPDELRDMLLGGAKRESSGKGMAASMTQDSADELNGQFRMWGSILFDVRGNQLQMLELQRTQLPNLQHLAQLTLLPVIAENTAYCRKLEGIEQDMGYMRRAIETIRDKGITIKR